MDDELEDIIRELNPECRIGEYRDRIEELYEPRIKQLESDIKEYKDVIDSLKQKIDVSECLYEDSKKEIKQLESDIGKLIKKWKKEYNNTEYSITAQIEIDRFLHDLKALEGKDG